MMASLRFLVAAWSVGLVLAVIAVGRFTRSVRAKSTRPALNPDACKCNKHPFDQDATP